MTTTDPQPAAPKIRLRWYQYSLRSLLVVTALAGIGFSWFSSGKRSARIQSRQVLKWCGPNYWTMRVDVYQVPPGIAK